MAVVPRRAAALAVALASLVTSAAGAEDPKATVRESNRKFAGLDFGVALAVTYDTGSRDRVTDASIDANGIVRVNKRDNAPARLMLETHYLFAFRGTNPATDPMKSGWGPFVAVQPGENDVIDAIGLGLMLAWRRDGDDSGQSFNLGIGYVIDPNARVLGDEFRENEPAPVDGNGDPIPIRYELRDQRGILALTSFSW